MAEASARPVARAPTQLNDIVEINTAVDIRRILHLTCRRFQCERRPPDEGARSSKTSALGYTQTDATATCAWLVPDLSSPNLRKCSLPRLRLAVSFPESASGQRPCARAVSTLAERAECTLGVHCARVLSPGHSRVCRPRLGLASLALLARSPLLSCPFLGDVEFSADNRDTRSWRYELSMW